MLPLPTYIVLGSMILYGIVIIVHAIYSHEITRCSIEAGILIGVAVLLNRGTGFPIPKQPFGGIPPLPAIGIIFFCTILGTGGRYLFYKKGKFSWESFLKPVGIAPILFLPLIGAVKGISEFDFIQLLSLAVLAYQTGFFWKERFDNIVLKEQQKNEPQKQKEE